MIQLAEPEGLAAQEPGSERTHCWPVPGHRGSQNKGVRRSNSRDLSIIKKEGGLEIGEGGVGPSFLLKKVIFFLISFLN